MTIPNVLATAQALSNDLLLARLELLAGRERHASVELVAHLAALDARPSLFAAKGYSSLFAYCTQALRLSEDATCNRIAAVRACRQFPVILDLLASGDVSLTSVRLLGRHLTAENHEAVLSRARGRTRPQIEALVAELAPRPDVPTTVRTLPTPAAPPSPAAVPVLTSPPPPVFVPPPPRPFVQATAPERYRVQFTIGQKTHDELRELQTLLRREIPDGDAGAIVARGITLLLDQVRRSKRGAAARPRSQSVIRPRTDDRRVRPSRHVPRAIQRAVTCRDGNQCAFVSKEGHRCFERSFLEFHHLKPYAKRGPMTVENIALRCWRHNQYEAELVFGSYGASVVREAAGAPSAGGVRGDVLPASGGHGVAALG